MDPTSNNNNTGYGNSGVGASGVGASGAAGTPGTGIPGTTDATGNPIVQPTNPIIQPSNPSVGGISATEPIMQPEPAAKPDPIAEELSEPMKAAAPAPGSIGSAVSGPTDEASANEAGAGVNMAANDKQTPSVAFNDPANQPDQPAAGTDPKAAKKKMNNRTTLIILIAVAAAVIVGLIVVLVMQLNSGSSSGQTANNDNVNVEYELEEDNEILDEPVYLSCTREITEAELTAYTNAVSGIIIIDASFGTDGMLETINLSRTLETTVSEDETTSTEDVTVGTTIVETESEATGEDEVIGEDDATIASDVVEITSATADEFELSLDENGEVVVNLDDVRENYETLGYVCEEL